TGSIVFAKASVGSSAASTKSKLTNPTVGPPVGKPGQCRHLSSAAPITSGRAGPVAGAGGSGGGSGGSVPASGEKAASATACFGNSRSADNAPPGSDRHTVRPSQPPMTRLAPSGENRDAPTGAGPA